MVLLTTIEKTYLHCSLKLRFMEKLPRPRPVRLANRHPRIRMLWIFALNALTPNQASVKGSGRKCLTLPRLHTKPQDIKLAEDHLPRLVYAAIKAAKDGITKANVLAAQVDCGMPKCTPN